MATDSEDVTSLLARWQQGDRNAQTRLLELMYTELRRLAAGQMGRERREHTLQPTALVHEAYLRLVSQPYRGWKNRMHFIAAASQVMRQVLVDYARARGASKRGGNQKRIDLDVALLVSDRDLDKLLAVDHAMKRLATLDPRQCRIVELRFFGGMTEPEIADTLGIGVRTVKRDWNVARAWLYGEISR